jgi:flavin reductase (DIM6/NTAB) family NADH-FMN oxidoreductase RutF
MPVGFDPPRYALAIGADGHGTSVLLAAGAFVVHTVPAAWEPTILAAGKSSGRDGDKFERLGLPTRPAFVVDAPVLVGALGWLECRVENATRWDDRVVVVARVVHAQDAPPGEARLHHEWRPR